MKKENHSQLPAIGARVESKKKRKVFRGIQAQRKKLEQKGGSRENSPSKNAHQRKQCNYRQVFRFSITAQWECGGLKAKVSFVFATRKMKENHTTNLPFSRIY